MICPHCQTQIADGLPFCSNCGKQISAPSGTSRGTPNNASRTDLVYPKNPPLSPFLAALNIILPGVAQIVYGQVAKGIVLLISSYALAAVFGIGIIIYLASIVDAYMVGVHLQSGKPVGQWQFFPS
jgi:TM2 domain-containing membrane protein YozV